MGVIEVVFAPLLISFLLMPVPQAESSAFPAFQNIRLEEDWSVFQRRPRSGLFEKLKFIPLSDDERAYLSLGGQVRFRTELWNNFGFSGNSSQDDVFGLLRFRTHADLHLGSHVRLFVEGKSALGEGRDLPGGWRTLDVDSADFQHVLLELMGRRGETQIGIRLGRQELQFGRQRLVSPLDWSNTRPRTFDGAKLFVRRGSWKIDGFWSKHVLTKKYALNSSDDSSTDFFGVYSSGLLPRTRLTTDFYWLGIRRRNAVFFNVTGKELRQTLGARLIGHFAKGADFEIEAAYQFGDIGAQDISAAMLLSQVGYTFPETPALRLYIAFDFATGDKNATDGTLNTFNQLFPLGHAYFGHLDFVARQNIVDWSHGISARPDHWNLGLALHHFWRANTQDALYNAGGQMIRAALPSASRRIGSELDIYASFSWSRFVLINGGYGHFFAGPFLRDTGPAEDVDFAYLSLQYTF